MTTPINPTTPNPEQSTHDPNPPTQPFPSPQTFTILPQLYTIISHLAPLQSPSTSTGINPSTTSPTTSRPSRSPTLTRRPADQSQSQVTVHAPDPTSSYSAGPALSLTQTRSRDDAVELKDLPGLVYPLRQQLERAKEVVAAMPDVSRSVEEQEREILELRGRIVGLKGRLVELSGRVGGGDVTGDGDVVMLGVEG